VVKKWRGRVSSIELRVDGEGAPGATSDGSGACPAMTQAGRR
jgi:hypothetical protein